MKITKPRQRVIITNVHPQVSEGSYPAKAAVQESIPITADIFADGHDELSACVFVKHLNDRRWQELPMTALGNDRWMLEFEPNRMGMYRFKVQAWVNHFATWQKALKKKFEAGQNITVELQIGAALMDDAVATMPIKEQHQLAAYSRDLANEEDQQKAFELAMDEQLSAIMDNYREPGSLSIFSKTLLIDVERWEAAYSTWYELFPRSTAAEPGKHGTFADVQQLLPRLHQMGFDVLYLPPIHPIGEVNRKGKNNALEAQPGDPGSPWAVGNASGGHKAIHKELGGLREFTALIKAAKKLNMELAMDLAFQCAPDHPYVKQHPQWFKWRPDGKVQYAENPPKRYEDILPFHFDTDDWENLWLELKSIVDFWISKGIRIFRVDNPHTKPLAFWEWLIAEVRSQHPDIIFLAEAFTRPRIMEQLAKAGFTQSYTYFTWRHSKQELQSYMNELCKTPRRYYFRPNFWPNTPDILSPELAQGGENMHIIRLILAGTLSSNYGLYGPVYEFGISEMMPGKEEYNNNEKYEVYHWDWSAETRLREIITLLNFIRRQNRALQCTWNIHFAETSNDQLIAYVKTDFKTGNALIIVVNLDPHQTQSGDVILPLDKLGVALEEPFQVLDLLSRDRFQWQGARNYVQLNPQELPAHILRIESKTTR